MNIIRSNDKPDIGGTERERELAEIALGGDQRSHAESRTRRLIDRYAVTIRWITALAAAVFCLLSPRVSGWQVPICVLVLGWAVLRLIQRRRPTTRLLLVLDTIVVCVVGLTQPLTSTPTAVLTQTGFGAQHLQSGQPDVRLAAKAGGGRRCSARW